MTGFRRVLFRSVTEELIFHILNHLQKRTGLENVCIAGGVAQNSVEIGRASCRERV